VEVTYEQLLGVVAGLERRAALPRWRQKLEDFVRWTGSKSNYLSKKVVELYAGGVAFTAPTHVYLAALTVTPDDTSTGSTVTETDYASYARTEIGTGNNQTDAWNAGSGTTTEQVSNKNAITLPTATGASTNPLIAVAVVDASSNGNVLVWATITSTAIASGDTPKINASGLTITED
jgi:hypothetical protein